MIFYFSGTGNSRWAAGKIAEHIKDAACDIMSLEKIPGIVDEKQIGFVFPVYAWGVPEPMLNFVKRLEKINAFVFGICTCGEDAGLTLKKLSRIYKLDSAYSLIMPSNYIIGADVEDTQTILSKIKNAEVQLHSICEEIIQRKKEYCVNEGKVAWLKSNLINWGFNKFARTTKPFYVTDQCTGCGQCARRCPASAIILKDERPHWKGTCYQCMRCINECPQTAVQYGNETEKRGRYRSTILNEYNKI